MIISSSFVISFYFLILNQIMETNRRIGPCFDTTKSRSSNKIDFRLGMLNVIDSLMKNENSWLFNKPVDPKADGCPNYFNIIKHPMDFGTIRVCWLISVDIWLIFEIHDWNHILYPFMTL